MKHTLHFFRLHGSQDPPEASPATTRDFVIILTIPLFLNDETLRCNSSHELIECRGVLNCHSLNIVEGTIVDDENAEREMFAGPAKPIT
jgi:hypothetical protein